MASGHANHTNRPNTWPHRPTCVREESPCQPGAVHTWHWAAVPECPYSRRVLEGRRTSLATDIGHSALMSAEASSLIDQR
jgi:hypothetical protein